MNLYYTNVGVKIGSLSRTLYTIYLSHTIAIPKIRANKMLKSRDNVWIICLWLKKSKNHTAIKELPITEKLRKFITTLSASYQTHQVRIVILKDRIIKPSPEIIYVRSFKMINTEGALEIIYENLTLLSFFLFLLLSRLSVCVLQRPGSFNESDEIGANTYTLLDHLNELQCSFKRITLI